MGTFFYRGHFVSGGFFLKWLFDLGSYCPVVFVQGLFAGFFDPEPVAK